MEKLSVAIISESAGNWPVYVGMEKGFFAAQGLQLRLEITRSSLKHMEALKQGGIYDLGHQSADHVVRAVEDGSDLFAFMGLTTPYYSLMVTPSVKCYANLKGKTLGVDGLNTGFALLLQGLLRKNGLEKDVDYSLKQVGGTGERLQALLKGEVWGAFLDGPADLVAELKGFRRLGSNLDYLSDYQGTVAATSRKWALQNEKKLLCYIRGYVEALRWLSHPENRIEGVDILSHYLSMEREIGLQTYDRYMEIGVFNWEGKINREGMANVIKVMVSAGQLPSATAVDKYCDYAYLERALNR